MTSAFQKAEWDSDALVGDTFDELFKAKNSKKKHGNKLKNLKTLRPQLNKKMKKKFKTNLESSEKMDLIGNSENNEILSKSKRRRLKKIKRKQKQHENDEGNENKVKKGLLVEKPSKVKERLLTKNRNQLKNETLNSDKLKTESAKSKKKHRKLKKRLEAAVQNGNFMDHVKMTGVVKEQENLIKNMKPDKIKFESPSKTPKKQVSSPKVDKKAKFFEKLKQALTKPTDKKPMLTLRQRMLDKLKAARFRFLNEQIYSTDSKEAQKIFQNDPNSFKTYHEGYRKQVKRWPLNPLDVIIKNIKTMPKTYKVADFGCGDAKLSKSVTQEVFSFDLVAADETVIACDMSKVPLEDQSVDVVVFCLSLMGTNLHDYLLEANRVLKTGGILKIAEVESRFEDVNTFIKGVQHFGFKNTWKDLSHNLFYFMDFKKNGIVKNKKKAPALSLLPCLYKKR